jgi:hypothetical protein
MSIRSTGSARRFLSSRRPQAAARVPLSARSRKSTIICACLFFHRHRRLLRIPLGQQRGDCRHLCRSYCFPAPREWVFPLPNFTSGSRESPSRSSGPAVASSFVKSSEGGRTENSGGGETGRHDTGRLAAAGASVRFRPPIGGRSGREFSISTLPLCHQQPESHKAPRKSARPCYLRVSI